MEKIKYYKWAIVALAISLALAAGWDIGNTMMIGYWKNKYYEIEDNIVKVEYVKDMRGESYFESKDFEEWKKLNGYDCSNNQEPTNENGE